MPDVNMPKLSDTMEEGSVLAWIKKDGDEVHTGDVIAEIETDKASFEIQAEADGVLHVAVAEGKPVPVGDRIATIGGEPLKAEAAPDKKQSPKTAPAGTSPAPEKAAAESGPPAEGGPVPTIDAAGDTDEVDPAADGEAVQAPHLEPAPPPAGESQGEIRASPLARRLAAERGVDLASLRGSGPDGRIVKEDVLAAAGSQGKQAEPAAQPAPRQAATPPSGPEVTVREPTRMQSTISKRMTLSKTTVPHFYVTVEVRMDEALRVRAQLKETVPSAEKVSVTDMLVRACALALRQHPDVNASWTNGHFELKRDINIGVAVAQEGGLIVPVVREADRKDLVQISIESRQLIERARAGKASQADLTGGTFSISNLGMFGVDEFQAIVNPPEAAILAVGGIKEAPVVEAGRVVPGMVMRMTLSCDHRVFYGAEAAQFLADVRRLMENPVSLVLPPG